MSFNLPSGSSNKLKRKFREAMSLAFSLSNGLEPTRTLNANDRRRLRRNGAKVGRRTTVEVTNNPDPAEVMEHFQDGGLNKIREVYSQE